jgi:7-cyano-7-deazaguanine synthase
MKRLGLVMLSGGLDSTTVAAGALRDGYSVTAVTVKYGQSHVREIDCAVAVASKLGLHHLVVDVDFYRHLAWYSALTSPERFPVPKERQPKSMGDEIPVTYVPLRNTFLLTLGAALLESEILVQIEEEGISPRNIEPVLFIAANAIDYSGYPDCRPEYYEQIAKALTLGSKIGTQYGLAFRIETPLLSLTKREIVRLASDLKAPLELTWSCYRGAERPCGSCDSCILRAKGFAEAGVPDPALVPA